METEITPNRVKPLVKKKKAREEGYLKAVMNPNGKLPLLTNEEQKLAEPDIFAQRVEKKAYELYEKRGRENGHDCEDWLQAEKEVEAEMIAGK